MASLDIDQFYRKKEEFQSQLDDNEEKMQIKTLASSERVHKPHLGPRASAVSRPASSIAEDLFLY